MVCCPLVVSENASRCLFTLPERLSQGFHRHFTVPTTTLCTFCISSSFTNSRPAGPKDVIVTGTFDNWSKSFPLVKQKDNSFELTVPLDLSEPVYFKYVVDGEWLVNSDQDTTHNEEGIRNNIVSKKHLENSSKKQGSRIPEAGGLAAKSGEKAPKPTVLPSSEGKQTTLGEPGIAIPQDKESLAAFENVRNVDPKTLNEEPKESAVPQSLLELSPEERKKQKKKLKKTQYRLKKKQQKAALSGSSSTEGSAKTSPEPQDKEDSLDPKVLGAIIGGVGGAAAGGSGAALVGALGGAASGEVADSPKEPEIEESEEFKPEKPTKADYELPGSIEGVDKNVKDPLAQTDDLYEGTDKSKDHQDATTVGAAGAAGVIAGSQAKTDKTKADKTQSDKTKADKTEQSEQKENTKSYPVSAPLTENKAAAVPVTAVEEPKAEVTETGKSQAKSETEKAQPLAEKSEEKPLEKSKDSKDSKAPAVAGAAGAAGAAAGAAAAEPEWKNTGDFNAPKSPPLTAVVDNEVPQHTDLSKSPKSQKLPASNKEAAPVAAKEVDASPVTKGDGKTPLTEEEIIIAQGGTEKEVQRRIVREEGNVSLEEIQPTVSEAERIAKEAEREGAAPDLVKEVPVAAAKAESAKSEPRSDKKLEHKKLSSGTPKPKPAAKQAANDKQHKTAAAKEAQKTKKSIFSKLKKIFK